MAAPSPRSGARSDNTLLRLPDDDGTTHLQATRASHRNDAQTTGNQNTRTRSGTPRAARHPYSLRIVHEGYPTETHTTPYAWITQKPMMTRFKRRCTGVRFFEVKSQFIPLPRAVCAAVSEFVAMRP